MQGDYLKWKNFLSRECTYEKIDRDVRELAKKYFEQGLYPGEELHRAYKKILYGKFKMSFSGDEPENSPEEKCRKILEKWSSNNLRQMRLKRNQKKSKRKSRKKSKRKSRKKSKRKSR